jgi:hypothetical protein
MMDGSQQLLLSEVSTPTPSPMAVGESKARDEWKEASPRIISCPLAESNQDIHVFIDTKNGDRRLYGTIETRLDLEWIQWYDAKDAHLVKRVAGNDRLPSSLPVKDLPAIMKQHDLVYIGVCGARKDCKLGKQPAWAKERKLGTLTEYKHETLGTVFEDASATASDGPTKYYDVDGNLVHTTVVNWSRPEPMSLSSSNQQEEPKPWFKQLTLVSRC